MLFFLMRTDNTSPLTILVRAEDEISARQVTSKEYKNSAWLDVDKSKCWSVDAVAGSPEILMDTGEEDEAVADLAIRPDEKGNLDDIFVREPQMFRMERMSKKYWWMNLTLKNGEDLTFSMSSKKNRVKIVVTEFPDNAIYEAGSIKK